MAYRLYDLQCQKCQYTFEYLIDMNDKEEDLKKVECQNCDTKSACIITLSAPRLNTMNLLSKEEYSKKMAKRSVDHSNMLRKKGLYS